MLPECRLNVENRFELLWGSCLVNGDSFSLQIVQDGLWWVLRTNNHWWNLRNLAMKKLVSLVLMGVGALVTFIACLKDEDASRRKESVPAVAITMDSEVPTKGDLDFLLKTKVGHTKEECGGTCFYGIHKDCHGFGDLCEMVGRIGLEPPVSKGGVAYSAVTQYPEDFSDEETFLMPDRSFKIEGQERWLNIPEQVFLRDIETRCFRIQGITFTDEPLYINE